MAIEAMKAAAVTYQGSVSGAAKPVQVKDSVKTEKSASEAEGSKPAASMTEEPIVKPMQPVRGKPEDRADQETESGNGHQTSRQLQQAVEKLRKNMMAQTEAV